MDILDQKDSQQLQSDEKMSSVDQNEKEINRVEPEDDSEEKTESEDFSSLTAEELVAKAKSMMEGEIESYAPLKAGLDSLKHFFYKQLKQKNEELKKSFLESGGVEEDYADPINPLEVELKEVLNLYREKRNAELQRIEKVKNDNFASKNRILEELKALVESSDDFGKKVQEA